MNATRTTRPERPCTNFRWKLIFIAAAPALAVTSFLTVLSLLPPVFPDPESIMPAEPDTVRIAGNAQGLFLSLDAGTASRIISPTVRIDAAGGSGVSVGCGFLIAKNGLIISSWHVVANAGNIVVTLASGESFQGQVLAQDMDKDLALIKLLTSREDLPALSLAASKDVFTGMTVMAVSYSPEGLPDTPGITAGVVTAMPDIDGRGYILTDASVRAGTGEPLVNCQGIVVGVCLDPDGGNEAPSVGLAISAADCLAFLHASNIGY